MFTSTMVENKQKKDYEYFQKKGSITQLDPSEKDFYLEYFKSAYDEDLEHSKNSLIKSPKWTIIAGYYAMHNISKYYLGLNFQIKISLPEIHSATIVAIKELVDNKEVKNLICEIEDFSEIEPLYFGLVKAKDERSKTQYYISKSNSAKKITLEKANYFLNNVVEKYIQLMEKLIKNVN